MALVVAAIFGALAAWIIYTAASAFDLLPPQIPWSAPGGLVLIGVVVAIVAYTTHQKVQVRRERVEPQRAVAFLVLGKAAALAGAMVAGGYLTYALLFVARFEAEAPRERVIRSGLAVLTGIGLSIAGLFLERACRVPGGEGEDQDDTAGDDEPTEYGSS